AVPHAGRGLRRAGDGPPPGRLGPDHHRDRAGHPRGQGRDLRRPRGLRGHGPDRADPDLRVPAAQRRQ
ncbi:MAG: 5-methyltetrahydrofolate--homocysteine methyltransferase, partial [uncultured Thermoleophilia bacterium]